MEEAGIEVLKTKTAEEVLEITSIALFNAAFKALARGINVN